MLETLRPRYNDAGVLSMKRLPFLILLFWAGLIPLQNAFVEQQPVIAIECGRLLNSVNGELTADAVILIQGERIIKITSQTPANVARVIDLKRYTVLPGLIDSHTHILLQPEDEGKIPPVITKSQSYRTIQGVAAVRKELESGFTTLRDLDSEGAGFADVDIRDAINRKIIPGPRLFVSTLALSITAGHMNLSGLNSDLTLPEPSAVWMRRSSIIPKTARRTTTGRCA